jgi:Delta3-Delta2-enoyl-CoA isomerase
MRWGLAAEGCSTATFPMQMGHYKAAALLIAGEVMSAQELYVAGLITRILPADGFLEKVLEVADRMAGYSQSAIRLTRDLLRRKWRNELHEANLRECQALRERSANNDALPNIWEFIEEEKARKARKAKL